MNPTPKAHNAAFLALVNDAKQRVKEIDIEGYKKLAASGEAFQLIDVREESEFAAGHAADVQFQQLRAGWRRGDRKASPATARQQDIQVLSGLELKILRSRQAQKNAHDIVRPALAALDAAWQALDARVPGHADAANLDPHVR